MAKLVANEEAKASARAAATPGTKPEKIARIRVPYDEDKHKPICLLYVKRSLWK